MNKTQFTGETPWLSWIIGSAVVFYLAAILFIHLPPSKVEAQFAGQPTFSQSFTVNVLSSAPPGLEYVNIQNRGQLGEMVSYSWAVGCVPASGSTATMFLEGSNDGTNWFTLASSEELDSGGPGSAILYSNGYFNQKRLAWPSCANGNTFKGVYIGYGTPLPLTFNADNILAVSAQAFANVFPALYHLVRGFQCYNPNSAVAYVYFNSLPIAGPLIVGVPASGSINYDGPPFLVSNLSTLGAFNDTGHAAAVSTAVPCSLELSGGPFYPLSPPVAP